MPSTTPTAAKKIFLNKKIFLDKRFYIHVRGRINTNKAAELIRIFGGQIDEFLESTVSYVLTDIPKREWPENGGSDDILKRARGQNIKLMSLYDLTLWCSSYLSSQSSSDEEDEIRVQVTELHQPYIKFEDINGYYAPTAKEFPNWPGSLALSQLQPIPTGVGPNHLTRRTDTEQQIHTNNTNINQSRGVKRRHSIFCEICNLKLSDKLEDHVQSVTHKTNMTKSNWNDLHSVINSLPGFASLCSSKSPSISRLSEPNEFLCLHKVETFSQFFKS